MYRGEIYNSSLTLAAAETGGFNNPSSNLVKSMSAKSGSTFLAFLINLTQNQDVGIKKFKFAILNVNSNFIKTFAWVSWWYQKILFTIFIFSATS